MSLLSTHLEQITLCADSIGSLPFPPPQIFTNALLAPHDITALIRDTEPHERALFSVPPPQPLIHSTSQSSNADNKSSRRQTVFNVTSGGEVTTSVSGARAAPRRNTAVASVLGADLNDEIRRTETLQKGEIDVEVLLRGAEKLLDVYTMDGARERIGALRNRFARLQTSLKHYEARVAKQARELERGSRAAGWEEEEEDEEEEEGGDGDGDDTMMEVTDDDLLREEEEIRELERKKKELEERVSGMERDLGGLLR